MTDLEYRPPLPPIVAPGDADLHVSDMTATFSADMTLGEAQRRLAEHQQWLAVDGPSDATIGELVDRNSTGPLRLGYGAWRDLLLGAQFQNGKGELITAGGRTVKNVAGYDLTKFMVGQRGAFGRLVTLTMRTYRLPAGALLVEHEPSYQTLQTIMPSSLRPQWSLMTKAALFFGYLGDTSIVDWYRSNVPLTQPPPRRIESRGLLEDSQHRQSLLAIGAGGRNTFRAIIPPARVEAFAKELPDDRWIADPAFGVVTGTFADASVKGSIESLAARLGGSVSFGGADGFEFSTSPVQRQIIDRLKQAFDPDAKLNPLPWQSH